MSYEIIADKLNIRSITENNKPRYIIKATAGIPNKKSIIEYTKNTDGTFNTTKNMFTPHCIESMKKQSKNKGVFIDIQHQLARDASLKAMVKDKFTPEEQKQFNNMLGRKRLPLAKLNDINIIDGKLDIEVELNSMFKELDEDHKKFFDVVWYSLEKGFLNGVSANFGEFTMAKDDQGDMVVDDVDVLGYSLLDAPSEYLNSVYEVAIRAIEDKTGEGKMEDEKKALEEEKAKLAEDKKKFEDEKAASEAEAAKTKEEKEKEAKEAEIKKQEAEKKKIEDDLAAKTEALKKAEEEKKVLEEQVNKAKGVVGQQPPPIQGKDGKVYDAKFYKENIADITADHDKTVEIRQKGQQPLIDNSLKGLGQLSNLAAKAKNFTADMDPDDARYINERKLLDKGKADIIAPKAASE